MLLCYTGPPGSGKSYHAVADIMMFLRRGRFVYANFPLFIKKEKLRKRFMFLDFDFWANPVEAINFFQNESVKNCFSEGSAKIFIDEAQLFMNCREFMYRQKEFRELVRFFSQSRKWGYDICLITQDLRMLDRQIRSLVETEFVHRCLNNSPYFFWLPIKVFVVLEKWVGMSQFSYRTFVFFRKSIGNLYNTRDLFGVSEGSTGGG